MFYLHGCVRNTNMVTSSIRPNFTSEISRLAAEISEAIKKDPLYGPRHERERRIIGVEHEILLEQSLRTMKISFETEAQLRIKGTARTPDILLSVPLGVKVPKRLKDGSPNYLGYEWKTVWWIDSKAYFGDDHTHNHEIMPQAEAFVNRFGPGLILYWYGHAPLDRLADAQGDIAIIGWNLPECFLLPNGKLITDQGVLKNSHTAE